MHDMWAGQVLQALLKPFLELHSTAGGSGLIWNRRWRGEEREAEGKATQKPAQTPSLSRVVAIGAVVKQSVSL